MLSSTQQLEALRQNCCRGPVRGLLTGGLAFGPGCRLFRKSRRAGGRSKGGGPWIDRRHDSALLRPANPLRGGGDTTDHGSAFVIASCAAGETVALASALCLLRRQGRHGPTEHGIGWDGSSGPLISEPWQSAIAPAATNWLPPVFIRKTATRRPGGQASISRRRDHDSRRARFFYTGALRVGTQRPHGQRAAHLSHSRREPCSSCHGSSERRWKSTAGSR